MSEDKQPPFRIEDGKVIISADRFAIDMVEDLRIGNMTRDELRAMIREEIAAAFADRHVKIEVGDYFDWQGITQIAADGTVKYCR